LLVLTRRKDEVIKIGDDIEITIVAIKNNSVRVGIDAPKYVDIVRKEIYDNVSQENISAAKRIDLHDIGLNFTTVSKNK